MRLGPSSSATTSTTERALPSSSVQARCWSRPSTTIRLPLAKDLAACSAWSRHDHGEERRLLLPPARRPPEHGPGDTTLGVADLGLVGEVAGEAQQLPRSWCIPPEYLAGRSALPLDPGDGGHRGMPQEPQGQAMEPTKSAMHQFAGCGQLRCPGWLAECLRLGVGHARNRPARSLHPGRGGRTRLPRELLAARPRQGLLGRQKTSVLHQLR